MRAAALAQGATPSTYDNMVDRCAYVLVGYGQNTKRVIYEGTAGLDMPSSPNSGLNVIISVSDGVITFLDAA